MQPKECQATAVPPGLYEDGNERKACSNTYCWTKRISQHKSRTAQKKQIGIPTKQFCLRIILDPPLIFH